jgi:uncharacterized membrane protein
MEAKSEISRAVVTQEASRMSETPALHMNKSIFIGCPIDQVWAYLNDETKDPEWRRPWCKQVKRIGQLGVGTRFEGVDNMGSYTMEIVHFEPSVRLSWRELSMRPMKQRFSSYLLEPEGTGTKATIDLTYDTIGLKGKLMLAVVSLMKESLGNKLVRQMKEGVEATCH